MRRRILAFFVLASLLIPTGMFAESAEVDQLEALRQHLQKLQVEQDRIQQDLSVTQAERQSLQQEVNALQYQIRLVENQIAANSTQIDITRSEIGTVQDNIAATRGEMSRKRETIGRLILFLEQRDHEDLVASLFKFAGLSQFFREINDTETVQKKLLGVVNDLKTDKASLEGYQTSLESKEGSLQELNAEAALRKNQIAGAKNQQAQLLSQTKGQEAEYQKMLAENEALERQVNLEIYKIEERLRRAIDPNSQPRAASGVLAWPVKGTITQAYGCVASSFARRNYPDCNSGRGGFHNGLDIAAPYGTLLRAADDGTVIATGYAPYAYGIWVAIEHANGLVTAYTHMSGKALAVGQQVLRGDVVGSIGSTGLSTGNHIHFMVYAPKTFTTAPSSISGTLPIGATLNPSDYL